MEKILNKEESLFIENLFLKKFLKYFIKYFNSLDKNKNGDFEFIFLNKLCDYVVDNGYKRILIEDENGNLKEFDIEEFLNYKS